MHPNNEFVVVNVNTDSYSEKSLLGPELQFGFIRVKKNDAIREFGISSTRNLRNSHDPSVTP